MDATQLRKDDCIRAGLLLRAERLVAGCQKMQLQFCVPPCTSDYYRHNYSNTHVLSNMNELGLRGVHDAQRHRDKFLSGGEQIPELESFLCPTKSRTVLVMPS